ncbi:MAG: LamG domain-containing protein, partial [Methanosarcinaceae archaeon]
MTYLKKLIIIAIVITCISAGAYFVNALIGGGNNTTQISSLQKGLVGHWPLDKESLQSATTFADKTPYENVGTKYGSVLKFDGVDDYVNCGNDESLDITNAITISAWVNLATLSPTGSYPSIVKKYTPASSGYGMNYRRTENRFGMAVYDGTEHLVMTVADGCVVDTWYHVVGTWDGATMIMYVNGTTSGTPVAHDGSIVNDAGSLNVGTYGSSSQAFDGSIGDTRIYNRALSEAEILTLYEGGAVSETGLVAHYKFGDKAGATLTDETANNNDGTLTGFTSTAAGYGDTHDSGWNTNATPNVFAPDNMGQSGRAMSFDGASDYVNCGDDESLDITEAITISAWVKTDDKTSFKGILCKEDSGGVYNYLIYVMDSSFRFQSYNGRVLFSATTGAIISENTWYYVVGTFDESLGSLNGKIYLDGELKGQYTYTSPLPTNNANVSIGKYGTAEFNGSIADVRIYNRALEPEEITMLYEQYRPKLSVG